MKKYDFYEDGGHGWLKVAKKELELLGIANKITGYSYMLGDWAYLEEDSDMSTFADALNKKYGVSREDFRKNVVNHYSDRQSIVRSYHSYRVYTTEEKIRMEELRVALINSKPNWSSSAINKFLKGSMDDLEYWGKLYLLDPAIKNNPGKKGEIMTKTKEDARQEAIDWQIWVSEQNLSYGELAEYQDYFTKLARRFGLTKEFRENGII